MYDCLRDRLDDLRNDDWDIAGYGYKDDNDYFGRGHYMLDYI